MAYADLATIQDTDPGDILTAAWCDQSRDNQEFFVDPPACSVYASSAQTLTSGASTNLTADTENFDNDSMHSTSTNTERITIQTAGRYLMVANVTFAGAADSTRRRIQFRKNDTTTLYQITLPALNETTITTTMGVASAAVLAASDFVTVRANQVSGGDLDTTLDQFSLVFMTR